MGVWEESAMGRIEGKSEIRGECDASARHPALSREIWPPVAECPI